MENKIKNIHIIGGAIFGVFGAFASYQYINGAELSDVFKILGTGLIVPIITSSITFSMLKTNIMRMKIELNKGEKMIEIPTISLIFLILAVVFFGISSTISLFKNKI